MSKTRVFIYGSCVSRDTFEHFDPVQFELVEYVARQSVLSAYTKPVELMAPPTLESRFQQRMVTGDFSSSLRSLLSTHGSATDLVLVDLTDERLGAYLLPDGSMVTRSVELIESGAEQYLPQGSQHIAFGTQQHFEYWSTAMNYIGERFQHYMPQATVVLLDLAWAEWSESGTQTPDSFGVKAADANSIFRPYIQVAAQALGAHVVSLDPAEVMSGPHHPWGDAPFHYAEKVYLETVRRLTGTEGRVVWGPGALPSSQKTATSTPTRAVVSERSPEERPASSVPLDLRHSGPNFLIAGTHRGGTAWLGKQLSYHPEIFMASSKASGFFSSSKKYTSEDETTKYLKEFQKGRDHRLRGERSVLYFWQGLANHYSPKREDAAAAVRDHLDPQTPVILSLRDPVSRAVSAYWHNMISGNLDLRGSIFRAPASTGIIDLGFYQRHYEHWANTVGPERVHVLVYDDIIDDPAGYVRQALSILGVADTQEFWNKTTLNRRENRSTAADQLRKKNPVSAQELSLLHELYKSDISFIEHIVGRRLDAWSDLKSVVSRNMPS
ncbi:hypothetical protein GCM10010413_50610 [Promicromonospora sukumoe]|nr:DUF6270 domain-containing protein [Promicromonospora sukumoe]